jgi:hypothetical protein
MADQAPGPDAMSAARHIGAAHGVQSEMHELFTKFKQMLTTSPNMVSMMSLFMEFANQEHDQAVHGSADDSNISQIQAATSPLLAADVPALEQHVKQAIQERKNLERSHANHAAAGTKYTAMTIDSDATKPLPTDIPKTLLVQAPIFAATQHLPADALAAFDAAAAEAARVYQIALVT